MPTLIKKSFKTYSETNIITASNTNLAETKCQCN